MAAILWVMGLSLLMQACSGSVGQTDRGCVQWRQSGNDVCCDSCYPGNRLVTPCGPSPKDLCTPCEPGTFTKNSLERRCTRCTQCVGAQVLQKECTATRDTQCGCKEGLLCGNSQCSFCVTKCGKGEEPTKERTCRPCPEGTFNDQIHQMCKPRKTMCPNPDQILSVGDASNDNVCSNISIGSTHNPKRPDHSWPLAISVVTIIALLSLCIIITAAVKVLQKREKTPDKKIQIIRPPSDEPQTLIAVECSFHEAQQEQGSSESLNSKDSSERLIA
ncbi:tumor necrosis factor receptor superfamily member 9a isoform X2 [Trachinotus anak]|uniref:tumor necrosis factor receptor superfamily member 9a isoform X2 n=1 Tax=Trachinotus anak TaxID=443729 RepID=UPI0039F1F5AA